MPIYERETHFHDRQPPTRESVPLYRGTQIIWYVFYVIEILLFFRFVLKLIGANPVAGFTSFIYSISSPLVAPFLPVIRSTVLSGSIIEWGTLLALLVWWLVAWGIVRLLAMGRPVGPREARRRLRDQEEHSDTP